MQLIHGAKPRRQSREHYQDKPVYQRTVAGSRLGLNETRTRNLQAQPD